MASGVHENPFMLLGLPQTMDLSAEQIEAAALELSARLHPDAVGGDPEAEARLAAVNDARSVLASPESRAIALLAAAGGPSASEDRSLPAGFLMEMMQVREALDEAVARKDAGEVSTWRAWALRKRDSHAARVRELFLKGGERDVLVDIRRELNAWRYIERMLDQIPDGGTGSI